ncbi:hypothetical protein [Tranquillimonas alkanivorans]|uniref:hypothetical protein n=1 Tax=Tranquillimonas alkanivorans TaxID=441119 RepID=UPI000B85AD7E|nr:hypothetical protein [Tranquillimonas alkanivorans]
MVFSPGIQRAAPAALVTWCRQDTADGRRCSRSRGGAASLHCRAPETRLSPSALVHGGSEAIDEQADLFRLRASRIESGEIPAFDAIVVVHVLQCQQSDESMQPTTGAAAEPALLSEPLHGLHGQGDPIRAAEKTRGLYQRVFVLLDEVT